MTKKAPEAYPFEPQKDKREVLIRETRDQLFKIHDEVHSRPTGSPKRGTSAEAEERYNRVMSERAERTESMKQSLKLMGKEIRRLNRKYPNDPEIEQLAIILDEIKVAFESPTKSVVIMELPAIKAIERDITDAVAPFTSEAARIQPEKVGEQLGESHPLALMTVKIGQNKIRYVVPAETQDPNAPVIIVAPQVHRFPHVSPELLLAIKKASSVTGFRLNSLDAIESNQKFITEVAKIADPKKIFAEGLHGEALRLDGPEKVLSRDELLAIYESMYPNWAAYFDRVVPGESSLAAYTNDDRITTQNIFAVDMIADTISDEELSATMVVYGAAHEFGHGELLKAFDISELGEEQIRRLTEAYEKESMLPLSALLAASGIHTVVLDFDIGKPIDPKEGELFGWLANIANGSDPTIEENRDFLIKTFGIPSEFCDVLIAEGF